MHMSREQRVKVVTFQRSSFPIMYFRRTAFAEAFITICLSSVAVARATPDDQLLPVIDQCFDFKVEGSTLTAYCAFEGIVPAKASVSLNDCIENSSDEMHFVKR